MENRNGLVSAVPFVAVAPAAVCACVGCKKEPALRLTYEVDVAAAYDGEKDASTVMQRARTTAGRRLDGFIGKRYASVSTSGNDLVVDLARLEPEDVTT